MISDRYVKLDLPNPEIHMVDPPPQNESGPQMDAICFIATM
jgi:hypothetical protein